MAEIASAYVRIRPSLAPEQRSALEELAATGRKLAEDIDSFLTLFAVEPAALEEENHD